MEEKLCPKFEAAFQLLGKRWTGLIIRVLMTVRNVLRISLSMIPNMSDRMLAERFKELEAFGIISRQVFPETPVRIEYELTEKGRALERVMNDVQSWADVWVTEDQCRKVCEITDAAEAEPARH